MPRSSRSRRPSLGLAAVTACALLSAACGPPLPPSRLIVSTRILGVKMEVTEPLPLGAPEDTDALGVRCQALPFEKVQLTPLIVNEEDQQSPAIIDPLWIACELPPGQGLFGCTQAALPTSLGELPECPQLTLFDLDPELLASGELPEFPSPCLIPDDGVADGLQDFIVPLSQNVLIGGSVEIVMFGHGPDGPSSSECANTLLSGETELDNLCIQAVQRLTVGPLEALLELAGGFGLELPAELPTPEEIPDGDRNPRIESFAIELEHEDGSTEVLGELASGDAIAAREGDIIKITTEAPERYLQEYLVPINGGRDGYETRLEDYSGRWFITWGQLLSGGSNDPVSKNEWTLLKSADDEDALPTNDRATLYYVVRDNRQGVDWWTMHVDVTPAP
ncbi:MAG: hypothetical protein H6713_20130 [Myxococcales bacterium]|nr:hypothetical protein [Myxococcales bacterium]MCB9752270.1 hypothetical protein [Myxococcales bacterium]